ncbi:T9SS type A sorting domain-containing protein [Paraflavitalea speifideaquila]|uniref:T9SS type A sorting domain-containing protein n=1 Tax=Paraflavitalea speifideaquila TaxID=3076558 RepID=UPI0028EADF58|nr:T9SS type A sorting domain-containing protein [Paraflavitalea speifideiaquila]
MFVKVNYTAPKVANTASYPARVAQTPAAGKPEAPTEKQVITIKNYPDPFSSSTTISFYLPQQSLTNAQLYNLQGQMVKQVFSKQLAGGHHQVTIQTPDLAPGIFMLKLTSGSETKLHRMLLSR